MANEPNDLPAAEDDGDDYDVFNDSTEDIIITDFNNDHPHLKAIRVVDPKNPCQFCRSPKIDEINLGPLYSTDEKNPQFTHYYCMLFAAGLSQNGADDQGILGFMPKDLDREYRRATRLKCIFCHVGGAPVGCCDRRCKAMFHFPCGLANNAAYVFSGNYESYCINHAPEESIPRQPDNDHRCPVCLYKILEHHSFVSGTCCTGAILHKRCIQRLAFSSGYFLKCPTCNSVDEFKKDMKYQGVFVPEQDASWERVPDAFGDMYHQHERCDAEICECPKGREYNAHKGGFMLARCGNCGMNGTHRQCGKLKTVANWICSLCLVVEERWTDKEKKAAKPQPKETKSKSKSVPKKEVVEFCVPENLPPASKKSASRKKSVVFEKEISPVTTHADVAKIFILPACRDFFPHNRVALRKYAQRRYGLPDWRMQDLFVNLVDIFGDTAGLLEIAKRLPDPPAPTAVIPVPNQTTPKSPAVKRRKSGDRKSYRKRSQWQKGVVKKKGKKLTTRSASKRSRNSLDETSLQDNLEENSSHLNLTNEVEAAEPQPSTSSKAILEGIRRSQTTLLRLATNGVDVAIPVTPESPSSNIQEQCDLEPPNKKIKLDDRLCEKSGTVELKDSPSAPIDCATNDATNDVIIQDIDSSSTSDRAISSSSNDDHNSSMRNAVEAAHSATVVSQLLDPEKSKNVQKDNQDQVKVTTEFNHNGIEAPDSLDQSLETSTDLDNEADFMDVDSPNLV